MKPTAGPTVDSGASHQGHRYRQDSWLGRWAWPFGGDHTPADQTYPSRDEQDGSLTTLSIRLLHRDGFCESQWLELAPGVTVLTGRNNVGKSRFLRAISNLS